MIDELWGHMKVAFANNTTFSITWENCGRTIFIYFMIWTAAASFYALQSFLMSSVAERLNLRLRNRIAQKLNRLPLAYFDAHRPGEVVSRATNDWTRCPRACSADCCSCWCRSVPWWAP
mgnify:FL=1